MAIEDTVEQIQKDISEIKTDLTAIKTLLKGYNGTNGLCEDFKNTKGDFYKFRRYFLMGLSFLVGSGLLGLGAFELLKRGGI